MKFAQSCNKIWKSRIRWRCQRQRNTDRSKWPAIQCSVQSCEMSAPFRKHRWLSLRENSSVQSRTRLTKISSSELCDVWTSRMRNPLVLTPASRRVMPVLCSVESIIHTHFFFLLKIGCTQEILQLSMRIISRMMMRLLMMMLMGMHIQRDPWMRIGEVQ